MVLGSLHSFSLPLKLSRLSSAQHIPQEVWPSEERRLASLCDSFGVDNAFDFFLKLLRRGPWLVVRDDVTVRVDKELCKVPLNNSCLGLVLARKTAVETQEGVHGVSLWTIDIDFGEHRELNVVFARSKLFDLGVGAWLLAHELVAGECENL